jgi:hypothetical protein
MYAAVAVHMDERECRRREMLVGWSSPLGQTRRRDADLVNGREGRS